MALRIAGLHLICCLALFGVAGLPGCDERGADPEKTPPDDVEIGREFDATTAGELRGRVTWQGAIPEVPMYRAPVSPGNEYAGQPRRHWPNPNVPHIDLASKGVVGAVVSL